MDKKPIISIIVAAYGVVEYLSEAIDSVISISALSQISFKLTNDFGTIYMIVNFSFSKLNVLKKFSI